MREAEGVKSIEADRFYTVIAIEIIKLHRD
jgi:hypothetical protein